MLRALEQIRQMRGGAQSHLMRCDDGNYYVVKFQNNPQHRRVLVNELLGTRLAGRLGLPTVPAEIVEVSEELIRLTPELAMELPRSRIPCQAGSLRRVGGQAQADDSVNEGQQGRTLIEAQSDLMRLPRGSGASHRRSGARR